MKYNIIDIIDNRNNNLKDIINNKIFNIINKYE